MPDDRAQRIGFAHSVGKTSPVDVLHLAELRARRMQHSIYDPTRLDFHLLQFVVAGTGRHWSDFEPVQLTAGDILYVQAGQVHAFDADSHHDAWMLAFTPNALADGARLPPPWERSRVLRPRPRDFEILLHLVKAQAAVDAEAIDVEPAQVGPHLLAAVLGALAGVVSSREENADLADRRAAALVAGFTAVLDEHHARSRNTGWYAGELGVSPRSLSRACHRARGLSPKRMIDRRVILEAKRLLTTTDDTVEAIGMSLGFTEATNFVKFFRRVVGQPPEAFRRSHDG